MFYYRVAGKICGRLAQLVAHLNDIQRVTGSSPVSPSYFFMYHLPTGREPAKRSFAWFERISVRTTRLKGVSPDSEQIKPAGAMLRRRNSVSVEEIQDSPVSPSYFFMYHLPTGREPAKRSFAWFERGVSRERSFGY